MSRGTEVPFRLIDPDRPWTEHRVRLKVPVVGAATLMILRLVEAG